MSPAEWRKERSRLICQRVSEGVAAVAPRQIGRWTPAWELVEAPSAAFLEALGSWVETGSMEDQRAVQRTAEAVRNAWREAVRQWEAAGRPGTSEVAHAS